MTQPTDETLPVAVQATDSSATNASQSSVPPSLPPTQQPTRSSEGREGCLQSLGHFFRPKGPFPVRTREIALYGLWNQAPLLSEEHLPAEVWERQRLIGPWYVTHLAWQPTNGGDVSWMTSGEVQIAFTTLLDRLEALETANKVRASAGTEVAQLMYRILHLEVLHVQWPRLYRLRSGNREKKIRGTERNTQEAFVEGVQRQFGLADENPTSGGIPFRFTHYDRLGRRRGWLVVSPKRALVAGLGAAEVRTLANLIQRRDTGMVDEQGGIRPERYEDVLGRISLWNGTQEVAETVSQLEELVENGKKSTDGQVLLNLALAAIAVIVALAPSLSLATWQLWWSLALFGAASVMFWRYAHMGRGFYWIMGLLCIGIALVLDAASFWFAPIFHFLSGLHFF